MEGLKIDVDWRRLGAMLVNRSPKEQSAFFSGFYHEKLNVSVDNAIKNACIKGRGASRVTFDEFIEDLMAEDAPEVEG